MQIYRISATHRCWFVELHNIRDLLPGERFGRARTSQTAWLPGTRGPNGAVFLPHNAGAGLCIIVNRQLDHVSHGCLFETIGVRVTRTVGNNAQARAGVPVESTLPSFFITMWWGEGGVRGDGEGEGEG